MAIMRSVQDFEELPQNMTVSRTIPKDIYCNAPALQKPSSSKIKLKNNNHIDTDTSPGCCDMYFSNSKGNRLRETQYALLGKVEVFLRVTDAYNTPPGQICNNLPF